MPDVTLLPDIEELLSAYYRTRPSITDLVAQRVYTVVPTNKVWPMARVFRIGGAPVMSRPRWLDAPRVQIDAWAERKKKAWELGETLRAELDDLPGSHPQGVVTGVDLGIFNYLPDPTFTTAKGTPMPRYQLDVVIYAHP